MSHGTGSFWFDDVQVKIDGEVFGNGAPDLKEPDEQEITLLNEKAIAFETGKPGDGLQNLNALSEIVGDAQMIALGENSHGSSSIYKLKLQMIKSLSRHMQVSVFALEMPAVEAAYINEYVQNGRGNPDEVLAKLTYPSWQTREMIDIIEWIKGYNKQHEHKIEFMGFDMQNGRSALNAVKNFAVSYDSVLSPQLKAVARLYETSMETGNPEEDLFKKVHKIANHLNSKSYPAVPPKRLASIRHYMDIFGQSLSFHFGTGDAKSRDEYMAENIRWIKEQTPESGKIIISGDNTHITEAGGKTGSFLSRWYKEDYISFGFTYKTGTYSAYGSEPFYEVHPPHLGTYEYFFSKSGYTNFILDLRSVSDIPILNQRAGFRSIGSRPQETTQFYEIDIKRHFDVVVYLETSKHTSYPGK